MGTEFHQRVREILEEALREPERERAAYIQRAAGQDPELLREVCTLLPHYQRMTCFEPTQHHRAILGLPGTTTFSRTADAFRDDLEWEPPFAIAPYSVVEKIGRGGMGVVYRARHPKLREDFAIKVLRRRVQTREERFRFKHEEEVLRQLKHSGIARLLHGGVARVFRPGMPDIDRERRPYLVMEFVHGQPLTRFAETHDLGPLDRLRLLLRICKVVEYAHHRGIVHCDLKPGNILVNEAGEPKVIDFGIAHVQSFGEIESGTAGGFAATIAYASPEQRSRGANKLTPASDVYTLGLIAHELLTGRLPDRSHRRPHCDISNLRFFPDTPKYDRKEREFRYVVEVVLKTALRQTRGQSYATAGDMAGDLAQIIDALSRPTGLRALWQRIARTVQGKNEPSRAAQNRPLAAVTRLRIDLGMERGDLRDAARD